MNCFYFKGIKGNGNIIDCIYIFYLVCTSAKGNKIETTTISSTATTFTTSSSTFGSGACTTSHINF